MGETVAQRQVGIDAFVRGLEALPEDDFVRAATGYVQGVSLDPASLEPYAFFVDNCYTRNLIFKNDVFEVLALCWQPGHVSSIHNHRDQDCWMVMAEGELENQNYRVHDRDEAAGTCRLEPSVTYRIAPGQPLTVDEDEPVHQVRNLPEFGSRAISIHIYSRPFSTCEVYCPEKGTYADVQLSYWSEYGERTQRSCGEQGTA